MPVNTERARSPGNPGERERGPVLVVDDNAQVRKMLRWALEEEGLAVQTAADGRAAIESIARQRPALVLLDIGLPLVDGDGVARAIRLHHGMTIPIVAITADGRAAEKARRMGAVAYFHKPFDLDQLMAAVRLAMGSCSG